MSILDLMREQDGDLLAHLIDSFENGDFTVAQDKWTLQDVEDSVQARIDAMSKGDPAIENMSFSEWLRCYEVLAQIRQAQALERIARNLDLFANNGFPVIYP